MKAIIYLLLVFSAQQASATPLWDALPALEPTHLQGLYAGREVCPMCAHGHDAGFMVFVPEDISTDAAEALAKKLAPSELGIESLRFRVFILITGKPNREQLRALTVDDRRWFVASLIGANLADTEKKIGMSLRQDILAFVFSQRRLLNLLDSKALSSWDTRALHVQSTYAVQLLGYFHTDGQSHDAKSNDVELWFAPDRLESRIAPRNAQKTSDGEICFIAENGASVPNALARVTKTSDDHSLVTLWARTDKAGCVTIARRSPNVAGAVELFTNLVATRYATLTAAAFTQSQSRIVTYVTPTPDGKERIVGLPCENCAKVFDGLPSIIPSQGRIADKDELGERMHLQGTVYGFNGEPAAGIIVYAYHTNRDGVYTRVGTEDALRVKLRGWVRTDVRGRYSFDTIRPGHYPRRTTPAHVHMHIIEPGRCTYYIDDTVFNDDIISVQSSGEDRGGNGVTTPNKDQYDVWQVTRDIYLGKNIPGYASCSLTPAPH